MAKANDKSGLRIVIKLGTSTLTKGKSELNRAHMLEIVRVIAQLKEQGHEVALVSSGAVAAGREVLSNINLPPVLSSKQLLASVGQGRLIEVWESLFSIYGIHIGQLLLTRADLEQRERYLNARDTIFALLNHGIVPVINENDAISTSEIKVGDNDTLSAITASAIDADKLILLTDQKGLYDADPRSNPDAKLIHVVDSIDERIIGLAGGSGTTLGTGGMSTKVKAASIATAAGVEMIIASGAQPQLIFDLLQGQGEGTIFKANPNPISQRKTWLAATTKPSAVIVVDEGAACALKHKHTSLLPSGVKDIRGDFVRGEVVAIESLQGVEIGKGISRYNSTELKLIKGCPSDHIEATLGFSNGVAVHRNDLVLS